MMKTFVIILFINGILKYNITLIFHVRLCCFRRISSIMVII